MKHPPRGAAIYTIPRGNQSIVASMASICVIAIRQPPHTSTTTASPTVKTCTNIAHTFRTEGSNFDTRKSTPRCAFASNASAPPRNEIHTRKTRAASSVYGA